MWILDKLNKIKKQIGVFNVYDEERNMFLDIHRSFFTFVTCPRLELIHFFAVMASIIALATPLSVETGNRAAYCHDHMKEDFCLIPWLMNGINQIKIFTLIFLLLTALNPMIYRNSRIEVDETTKRIGFTIFLQWMCFLTALPLTFVALVMYEGILLPHEKNYSASENASIWLSFLIMMFFGLFGSYDTNFFQLFIISVINLSIHFIFTMIFDWQGLKVYPALSDDTVLAQMSIKLIFFLILIVCLFWELISTLKDRMMGLDESIWKVGTRMGVGGEIESLVVGGVV